MFFESKPFVFFFGYHLRSSLGITCGLGIICGWVRKLRRVFRLPTSNFQLPTSNFRLQTSDFRLPTSVAIKSGGRPTRLLPYSKMLLVPITFFSFCLVDYALEGSTFVMSKCDLSCLFHTERPGGVRTTIAKHHGRYSKSDYLCQDGVE